MKDKEWEKELYNKIRLCYILSAFSLKYGKPDNGYRKLEVKNEGREYILYFNNDIYVSQYGIKSDFFKDRFLKSYEELCIVVGDLFEMYDVNVNILYNINNDITRGNRLVLEIAKLI